MDLPDCSIVFWLGDLNYRICDIESEECKRMIQIGKLEELMNYDQVCLLLYFSNNVITIYKAQQMFLMCHSFEAFIICWYVPAWKSWDSIQL